MCSSWAAPNTGAGLVWGTSESIAPSVMTVETPSSSAASSTVVLHFGHANSGSGPRTSTIDIEGVGEHQPIWVWGHWIRPGTPSETERVGRVIVKSTCSSGGIVATCWAPHWSHRCSRASVADSPPSFHPSNAATMTVWVEAVTEAGGLMVQSMAAMAPTVSVSRGVGS